MSSSTRTPGVRPRIWRTVLLTIWIVSATLIYFRQFAGPALRYLSRTAVHP
jgi:hypothetical protein